ncbi:dipeptidase [Haliangium sp.]
MALALLAGCKDDVRPPAAEPETPAQGEAHQPAAASASAPVPVEADAAPPPPTQERARALAQRFMIVDGHIDVPDRLFESRAKDGSLAEDISQRTEGGDFDYVRAHDGGLDAPFFSIYVPADLQRRKGASKRYADALIDMVEGIVRAHPEQFALAGSVAALEENFAQGKLTLLMGMENGSAIERDLANVSHFYRRGVRYITLAHSKDNQICDSSYDRGHKWKGLSPFGRRVVAEMNRIGIMIDVSHISDDAFAQVMDLTEVPVIASHSSARHFTPGWERNLSDDMIRRIGADDGVVMVNFGSGFLSQASRDYYDQARTARRHFMSERGIDDNDHPSVEAHDQAYRAEHPPVLARVEDVADHIDRVVELAGIDHVGLGSDFDGVGDSLPIGLEDVSRYPNLIQVLLERGYREADIEKICSGNLLRVWRAVEAHAAAAAPAR